MADIRLFDSRSLHVGRTADLISQYGIYPLSSRPFENGTGDAKPAVVYKSRWAPRRCARENYYNH
ncbi:hypothetical protein EA472_21750 [Natrarchaeobius oligotrophus]|uniref:Uncharacterized protein n=1 Tax=Natrarchaeobius chitinivorans TaxID=1679083 RepID=A0A3N6P928_NATCH|nr:hypothetical protein EA472_21750 [Natrarchaeobius chitinivorans]